MLITPPDYWAPFIAEMVHPLSIVLAILFPVMRAIIRKAEGIQPAFKRENLGHDIGSGLILPHFVTLVMSSMIPGIILNSHALALAGLYGIYVVIANLVDAGHGNHRGNY